MLLNQGSRPLRFRGSACGGLDFEDLGGLDIGFWLWGHRFRDS